MDVIKIEQKWLAHRPNHQRKRRRPRSMFGSDENCQIVLQFFGILTGIILLPKQWQEIKQLTEAEIVFSTFVAVNRVVPATIPPASIRDILFWFIVSKMVLIPPEESSQKSVNLFKMVITRLNQSSQNRCQPLPLWYWKKIANLC